MKQIYFFIGLVLLFAGIFSACKKDKMDHQYDNRVITDARSNSDVRLVNLAGHNQIIVNGDTLTNYTVIDPLDPEWWKYPGTKYFPSNGRLGSTWTIPRGLFKADGTAHLKLENKSYAGNNEPIEFDAKEDYNNPADYYLLYGPDYVMSGPPQVMEIPRSVVAPAKPDHFKIRVLNLAATMIPQNDPIDNFAVPLSLAWADGTPVSAATSGIAPGAYSEYTELPYGTYQFKVLDPRGIQVSATDGSSLELTNIIDPGTATLVKPALGRPHTVSTYLTYAPIRTYQPGGIYTIVISPNVATIPYYIGNPGETLADMQNTFRVIADIADPVNVTYARLQGVNALPGSGNISLRVNGTALGGQLPYTEHSDYGAYITGPAKIEALDKDGKVIAAKDMTIVAGQNYTAWVNPAADNKPQITIASNDLSGGFYLEDGDGQDGTYQRTRNVYPFNIRFLNFCPGIPAVNFTMDNGQPFPQSAAASNLQPAVIPTEAPYVRFLHAQLPYQVMAYKATDGIFPGTWMSDVPVLNSTDLIARKALYVRGPLPAHEPGVFTIALVGKSGTGSPESDQPKMIIIKHTK